MKCAPLSRELRKEHTEILVHTGQHYDPEMSDVFFSDLSIPEPDYHLGVGSGTHGKQTGEILARIEQVLLKEKPDMVIVFGDTNSTLAGALAGTKLHTPVAHVEAGLRRFDRSMPEEINRVATDHVSDLLFCPTGTAVRNLADEGITRGVHLVGDVMVDALEYNRGIAEQKSRILEKFGLTSKGYLVVTVHRPANTDNRINIESILSALGESGLPVLFPIHPRTKKMLNEYGLWNELPENIVVTEPSGTSTCSRPWPTGGISSLIPEGCRRRPTCWGCHALPCGTRPSGWIRSRMGGTCWWGRMGGRSRRPSGHFLGRR